MRRVTAAILALGVAAIAAVLLSAGWRRERAVRDLELGDDSTRVVRLLGVPGANCPSGGLDHLRERFPTGTPPATVEQAIARMQRETARRWVYALRRRESAGCVPRRGATEIGFDRRGRVLWYVPVTGRAAVVVPNDYLPSAGEND